MSNCSGFVACLVGVGLFVSGCGGETAKGPPREAVFPVSGKVMYKGAPVASADVTFMCEEKNVSAFGRTDAHGEFKLTTYASNDGAVAGKHTITVVKIETAAPTKLADTDDTAYVPPTEGQSTDVTPPKNLIPAKYKDPKATDLFATVTEGSNPPITLELKD
jgi:hypothetical protein